MTDDMTERARARLGVVLRGKYRIERVLGVGGMAAVYAASHRNGNQVAVKLLHPELSIRSDIRKRFIREAQAANAINHPGVVGIIDDDVTEDGATFLVMELLAGRSVEELWVQSGCRLSASTVLAIARELCSVLVAAHASGIVHRDIKPANLFVTDDGRLKVLDFGIARVRDFATTNLTDTGMLLGTPAFMAPEQAQGRVSEIDERTDVWAVGATMFTLFSGRVVHEGETAQHMTILAATQPARSLATVAPDAPAALVEVVDRALALSKSDRWASANALQCAVVEASVRLYGEADIPLDYDALATIRERASEPPATDLDPVPYYRVRVGETTSSPVSSTAPTEPRQRHQGWPNTLRMAPLARTIVSAFRSVRAVIRRESPSVQVVNAAESPRGEPLIASHDEALLLHRRPSKPTPASGMWLGGLLVAATALAVVVAIVVGSTNILAKRRGAGVVGVETARVPTPALGSATLAAPTPPTVTGDVAPVAPPAFGPDPQSIPREDVAPKGTTAPASTPRAKASPRPPSRSTSSPQSRPSPSASAPPRHDCNPEHYYDEAGNKRFKPECVH